MRVLLDLRDRLVTVENEEGQEIAVPWHVYVAAAQHVRENDDTQVEVALLMERKTAELLWDSVMQGAKNATFSAEPLAA